MNKKFYNLNPKSYFNIWGSQKHIEKSPFDFKRSLNKALSGNYKGVLFDEPFLDNNNLYLYLDETLKAGLSPALQITSNGFRDKKEFLQFLNEKYKNNLFFNIIFEEINTLPLKEIKLFLSQVFFTYIITKKNKKIPFKQKLPKEWLKKTELYFPYKKSFSDPFLTPRQVYKFIKKHGPVNPCQSEIYDSRIAQDMELEPITLPFAKNKIPQSSKKIFFSVIIPSYNNKTQLLNTLKNLALQNYPRDEYEIILVDDGSMDNTKQAVKNFMEQHPSLNLKAIYFPRVIERKSGDGRFRAGIARNLGVKHSEGEVLAFLDADILVPLDYFEKLKKEHEKADVILLKRYHLKAKTPIKNLSLDHEKLKNWYYIQEKNYWGAFYEKGFDKVRTPWKYICTYGLSLFKKDFHSVGAFGKNFIFYGFEDTDLGYRLFKNNKKFLLSEIKVYHQTPAQEQEKQAYNPLSRHFQLSKTAKIFFYKHLDPEIYEEMRNYMAQKRGLYYFFPFLRNKDNYPA